MILRFSDINPVILSVSLYEKAVRTGALISFAPKIIYLVSGEISFTLGKGKKERIAPGNLLYIPAGVRYDIKSKYMRAIVIDFYFTADLPDSTHHQPIPEEKFNAEDFSRAAMASPEPFDKPIFLTDLEAERDNLIHMNNIFISAEGEYLARISAMLKLLLIKINEYRDENALPSSMVENLDNYIRENIHDEISNTELGAIFGYHPFYISKILKDRRKITLHQYVLSFRFKLAKSLLRTTDRSIADIADMTGFKDASYFTKAFKAQLGMTPKEYRSSQGEDII